MRSYSFPAVLVFFLQAAMLSGEEVIRVACVGDSITFGAGVENRGQKN